MTAPLVLIELVEAGVVLFVEEGRLRYRAPVGVLGVEAKARAGAVRAALVALVRAGAVLPVEVGAWPEAERADVAEAVGRLEFEQGLDWEVARHEAERLVRLEHVRAFVARGAFVVNPDAVAVASLRPGSGPHRGP